MRRGLIVTGQQKENETGGQKDSERGRIPEKVKRGLDKVNIENRRK